MNDVIDYYHENGQLAGKKHEAMFIAIKDHDAEIEKLKDEMTPLKIMLNVEMKENRKLKQFKWVSVEDLPPEKDGTYTILLKTGVENRDCWVNGKWYFLKDGDEITHWLNAPEPPIQEEE